ncbi:cytochrome P450 [Crocosphaera subtropica ATCC 51142]|uniref:Cytochrome P450 n=2 Tax=Crocosphaera TaxID=263510 RepID=B1WTP6_CROS5|nr:cytochrome P450 [Crocosphaera subtropica ATCC 51142]
MRKTRMTATIKAKKSNDLAFPQGIKRYGLKGILNLIFRPLPTLESNRNRYGDIYYSPAFSSFPPFIVVGNPEGIEALFTADPDLFNSGTSNAAFQPLLGSQSILQLDGEPHKKRRKLLMPSFHGQRLQTYGEIITNITQAILNGWQKKDIFSMREVTQEITLSVILQAVFGITQGDNYQSLRQQLSCYLDLFNSPLYTSTLFLPILQKNWGTWTPWGNFIDQRDKVYELLSQEIDKRATTKDGEDILSLLLSVTDEQGEHLTKGEVMSELMTLLFAGHETTASALAWAFYWIHFHPEIYHNLQDELDTINVDTDPMEIAKLPYLNAVVSETLRIYPIALFAFSRTLKTSWEFMGYSLETGMSLAPCIYLVHHHPDIYPNSKQFQPERFLDSQFSPYEFIPFGGSNRRCLGYALALYEMKLVLATVLKQVNLKLVDSQPILPVRRGFTMSPQGGVKMQVI